MTTVPNARYERKFVARGTTLAEVISLVRRHPAGFRQAFPERVVNNIYLDSPGLGDYHDHVNGVANRVKTRVRWYGERARHIGKPALERKLKCGPLSGKAAHPWPAFELNGQALHSPLAAAFDAAQMAEPLRFTLRQLEPSLFNRYRRQYYVSADGTFRLTLDTGLQFARLCPTSPCPEALLDYPPSVVIIELKFSPQHAERAAQVTNVFPFRIARCSKYVLGIERSTGL